MSAPKVLLIVTQDTKCAEAKFVRDQLEKAGCAVIHLDASVRRTLGGAEISPEAIAAAAGTTIEAVRALGHEGKCLDVMSAGALKLALEIHQRGDVSGVLGIGGSMGTSLATAIMRALPYGLPKVMVSTMASGFTAPFVGVKDVTMMNAVTDVSGINSISRDVYRNAALATAGMAHGYDPTRRAGERPLVLMGTLGTTERCTARIREALEADGCEVMVFHTSGAGGLTMDSIAAERDVAVVLDLSLTEINDFLHGGLCGNPERGKAALRRAIPTIFAPGNIDFIIAGPYDQAVQQFPGRRNHVHNPALTAIRTSLEEMNAVADHVAALAAETSGPVQFFVPLRGFSNHDSPEGHIHDPSLPAPFAEHLRRVAPPRMTVTAIDRHFNDPEFADAITEAARAFIKARKAG